MFEEAVGVRLAGSNSHSHRVPLDVGAVFEFGEEIDTASEPTVDEDVFEAFESSALIGCLHHIAAPPTVLQSVQRLSCAHTVIPDRMAKESGRLSLRVAKMVCGRGLFF